MPFTLPRLRRALDLMPSPVEERPGLLIRDPFHYTDQIVIVPPLLAAGLALFDGAQTDLDLQVQLSRLAGELVPMEIVSSMIAALNENGFLETPELESRRNARHKQFAESATRQPAHQ